ncbi:pathogenesis-related family 1 protein [Streptomyces sp. NPDC002643]
MRQDRVRAMAAVAAAMVMLTPGAARAADHRPRVVEETTTGRPTAAATMWESATGTTVRKRDVNGLLTIVNKARADVGVPPLVWDESVAAQSRYWARVRVDDCALIHSNSRYGETLAKGSGPDFSLSDAARLWVDEKPDYDRATNSCVNGRQCLHYTQVVWRTSTRIGAAKTKCRNGWTYVVANFDPPGNWVGRRPY